MMMMVRMWRWISLYLRKQENNKKHSRGLCTRWMQIRCDWKQGKIKMKKTTTTTTTAKRKKNAFIWVAKRQIRKTRRDTTNDVRSTVKNWQILNEENAKRNINNDNNMNFAEIQSRLFIPNYRLYNVAAMEITIHSECRIRAICDHAIIIQLGFVAVGFYSLRTEIGQIESNVAHVPTMMWFEYAKKFQPQH